MVLSFLLFGALVFAQESPVPFEPETEDFVEAPVTYPSKEELAEKPLYWMCRAKSVVRTLKVEMRGDSCRVIYNKDGNDIDSGQSRDVQACFNVFRNIKRNLESNKWACRDLSKATIVSGD